MYFTAKGVIEEADGMLQVIAGEIAQVLKALGLQPREPGFEST